jgi:general secretion pathway protein K
MKSFRGAALIPALLVMSIASLLSVGIASRLDSGLQYAIYRRDEIAAGELAQAAIAFAGAVLQEDARTTGRVDHLQEIWAQGIGTVPVEGGLVQGAIRDAQALFNVNNLLENGEPSAPDVEALNLLAQQLGAGANIGRRIADSLPRGGASAMPVSPIGHIDELFSLPGAPREALLLLQSYLTALPARTKLNINTAAPALIAAYLPGIGQAQVQAVVGPPAGRGVFQTLEDFAQKLPPALRAEMSARFAVGSEFFEVQGEASQGRARVRCQAQLKRQGASPPERVYVKLFPA